MRFATRFRDASRSGFTFAELLAAMLFLSILVPVVVEGLTLANRAAVRAERSQVALQLAEKRLQELLLEEQWRSAGTRGEFGEPWRSYRWEFERGQWSQDDMTQLTVRVLYSVQGREHGVELTTLVSEVTE
jgi:type II secretory pathway pseudopilin PulG